MNIIRTLYSLKSLALNIPAKINFNDVIARLEEQQKKTVDGGKEMIGQLKESGVHVRNIKSQNQKSSSFPKPGNEDYIKDYKTNY